MINVVVPTIFNEDLLWSCSGLVHPSELAEASPPSHSRLQMEQTGDDDVDNDDDGNDDKSDVKVSVQYLRPPWTSEFSLYHECHTPTEIQVPTSSILSSSAPSIFFLPGICFLITK